MSQVRRCKLVHPFFHTLTTFVVSRLKNLLKKIWWRCSNNVIVNNVLVAFRIDRMFSQRGNPYIRFTPSPTRSVQENAGYSNRQEINEVLERSKQDLMNAVTLFTKPGDKLLDVGCGPGMYLSLFREAGYALYATDINPGMIELAKQQVPKAIFTCGDILEIEMKTRFRFIYCIGMLIYVPPSQLRPFLVKLHSWLEDDGVLYLNYPHAISRWDVLFRDITYVQYSPSHLAKMASNYFNILEHRHAFDGREVTDYDRTPYKSLNPHTHRTYKNSYLLIAKKKPV